MTDVTLNYDSVYDPRIGRGILVYRRNGNKAQLLGYDIVTPETAKKRDVDKNPRWKPRKYGKERPAKKPAVLGKIGLKMTRDRFLSPAIFLLTRINSVSYPARPAQILGRYIDHFPPNKR